MPQQHSRIARTLGAAVFGTALAITLGACSAPTIVAATETPKPVETGIDTGATPTATPSGAPVDDVDTQDGDFVGVFDDTHHVGVAVPASWSDVNGTGFVDGDGANWISVEAAPSISDYETLWNAPGVQVGATPFLEQITEADADTRASGLLTQLTSIYNYDGQCTATKTAEPYSDNVYTGYFSTWNSCGGTDTSTLLLTAYDNNGTHLVFVSAALVSDEDKGATLDSIINSFQASFDDRAQTPRSGN
jgi:hypothetical protein